MTQDPVKAASVNEVMELFDVVIESSKVGLRKPDPAIYKLACSKMDIDPTEAVFLDDLGINLKPARVLGMVTIKVLSANQALKDLEEHLGFSLR
jgi:putative hydrolase of the HAD superfamily